MSVCVCVCCYIRESRQSFHLVNTTRNGLRISDVTLNGMDLRTEGLHIFKAFLVHTHIKNGAPGEFAFFSLVLVLVSHLVSSVAADLLSCLLQDVQLPEQ